MFGDDITGIQPDRGEDLDKAPDGIEPFLGLDNKRNDILIEFYLAREIRFRRYGRGYYGRLAIRDVLGKEAR